MRLTIAGVNGSRKTTFALDYFKNSHATFINADLIVIGISSNTPDLSQFRVVNLCLLRFLPLNALALILIFSRFFVSVLWQIFCLNAFNLFFFTVLTQYGRQKKRVILV
jgi:hypothetical protein